MATDEDGAPCCIAWVTSGGRDHVPGCYDGDETPEQIARWNMRRSGTRSGWCGTEGPE